MHNVAAKIRTVGHFDTVLKVSKHNEINHKTTEPIELSDCSYLKLQIKRFAFELAGQSRPRPDIPIQNTAFEKIHYEMQTSANGKVDLLCFLPAQPKREAL